MNFGTTAVNVLLMLLYAVPGYLFVKKKAIRPDAIPAFSKVLLFVCQPCLTLYSFQKVTYSPTVIKNMGIMLGLSFVLQLTVLLAVYLFFRKRYENAAYRVCTVATVLGNIGFIGVPLLEALIPQYPEAIAYNVMFVVSMNFLSWTLCLSILSGERKFNWKRIVLNPPTLTLLIALPLFFTKTLLPELLLGGVTLLGKMTTPLCMLILGMRFAAAPVKEIFTDWRVYAASLIKLVVFPMCGFLLVHWLPIDESIKITLFILACCPTASVVLNLAEIYRTGQDTAASVVLVSTLLSMLTIPLLLLIL